MPRLSRFFCGRSSGYFHQGLKMDLSTILGIVVRHGLTILGGIFVSKGVLEAGDVEVVAGSGAAIAGVLLSIFNKRAK